MAYLILLKKIVFSHWKIRGLVLHSWAYAVTHKKTRSGLNWLWNMLLPKARDLLQGRRLSFNVLREKD
jgi:hypothetical protein